MSPMNPRKLVPTQEPGVLDFAPGAAAAYSLRNLSLSYSGPVVTVRRSTDDAEADFTASEVSDGTLAAWCGGGDGFVKTWWDQSGNARHATASGAAQPQIVDSGVLVTEGGKPAVLFDGVNDRLKSAFTLSGRLCLFGVANHRSTGTGGFLFDGYGPTPNACSIWAYSATQLRFIYHYGATARLRYRPFDTTNQFFFSLINTSDDVSDAFVNGSNVETLAGASASLVAMGGLTLGAAASDTGSMLGTISEIIVYESDQSALRTRIEGNLAWTYNA